MAEMPIMEEACHHGFVRKGALLVQIPAAVHTPSHGACGAASQCGGQGGPWASCSPESTIHPVCLSVKGWGNTNDAECSFVLSLFFLMKTLEELKEGKEE